MLVACGVCLLDCLENPPRQIVQVREESDLHYRPSPGFHQKVGIGSLRECVSSLARVVIGSRTPLILASIALVFDLVFVLL